MKGVLILGALVVLAIVGFFTVSNPQNQQTLVAPSPQIKEEEEKAIEEKASFAIFTNGTFRIFTAAMYHNRSGDVFIEASNPNIILVKKAGVTWDDFFKTLPMKLTKDCLTTGTGQNFCTNSNQTLKFYINGKQDPDALNRTIKAGDQLLVSYGAKMMQK